MTDGAIIGGVVGGVVFVAVVGAMIAWCSGVFSKRKANAQHQLAVESDDKDVHKKHGESFDACAVQVTDTAHHDRSRATLLTTEPVVKARPLRKKMEYIIDAVLNRKFSRDKEPATVENSGVYFVDHRFVAAMPR